ncbi:MAG: hypothetical protein K2J67_05615 [Lachnospiraceae bacterium]|nr:hypothetical protein [Lachnospiraceae bacterium]
MKQEYKEMQERLLPDREKQEEMWARMVQQSAETKQRKRKRYLSTGVAAVLVCMLILPQTGLADNMKHVLSQFSKKSDVAEDIQKNTYSDQDEHVKMQVKEMLSDGTCFYLGICYTALDQEGKEWLAQLNPDSEVVSSWDDRIVSGLGASSEYDLEYSIGWGENLVEQTNLATEKERHFIFSYFNDGDASVSAQDHYTLRYTMPEGFREFQVPREAGLEKIKYRVEKKDASVERFDLMYLHVSKLSFQLLVRMNSKFDNNEFGGVDSGKIAFIMNDGSKIIGELSSQYTPQKDSELMKLVKGSAEEYVIISGQFREEGYDRGKVSPWETINNPDQIAAVEISGDQYDYGDGLYHLVREK